MNELFRSFQPTITESGLKNFGLSLECSPPCDVLREVVHSYLQVRAEKPTPYPVMPDGTQSIFISPYGSMIGGAQSQACDVQMLETGDYFGIRFYPGALRYFFDLNLSEITDQFVDETYFPCRDFGDLHNSIYRYKNFHERAEVCEKWLLQHYKPQSGTQFDQALFLIYQSFGNARISHLADSVGWSSRHLNRLFRFHTGLNTKTFSKIIRIQHACRQLYIMPSGSLKPVLELGFFDQSHLIRDFRKCLLSNPGVFFDRFMSDFYNR